MDYVKVVVVNFEGDVVLCQAPHFSDVEEGDEVISEDKKGVVVCEMGMSTESNYFDFITKAFCITELPKLQRKVEIIDFNYEE